MQPMAGYPQPQPRPSSSSNWIVILAVVLGAVVVFGGIFAALAMAGVRKYLAAAKQAEALNSVGAIARSAESSFDAGDLTGKSVLCKSASQPVPSSLASISGKKYMSTASEWNADAASNAGFACLKFEMSSPQYYQYDYQRTGTPTGSAPGDGFDAIAHGDLDGDGTYSTFTIHGKIDSSGQHVSVAPVVSKNPEE